MFSLADVDWNPIEFTTALDGSVVMYKINGLAPETTYDVRVIRVESHSCIQQSSAIEQFTTPGELLHLNVLAQICIYDYNYCTIYN